MTRLSFKVIQADILAGLTVTLVGLPQCLAYAIMSGLPPAYGLSTAAVAGFVAAVVGLSSHVVTGPTNTTGLLILGALAPHLGASGLLEAEGLPALATLTLMAGALRIGLAIVGGAKLLRYLPESVLAGFTAGAGVLIGVMQLDEALGFPPFRGGGVWSQALGFWTQLRSAHMPGLSGMAFTVGSIAAIAFGRRWAPRWPVALLTIVVSAALAWALEGAGVDVLLVKDRAQVPSGWPPGAWPDLDPALLAEFFFPALAIVLLGTLELTVSARAGEAQPNMRREIAAQGWANVVGALASAFPASASLTRSALLRLGGARTRVAPAAAALLTVPILFFAGEAVGYIPQASLAGVLLITASGMLNRARLQRIWTVSRASRALLLVTFAGTLLLPLEVAILLGSGLGLLIHLGLSSDPRVNWLVQEGERLVALTDTGTPSAVVAEVSGTLYYAAVPGLMDRLLRELPSGVRALVVDVSHAHELRFAALEAFERLQDQLEARSVKLVLSGVSPEFARVLELSKSPLAYETARVTPGASAWAGLARV